MDGIEVDGSRPAVAAVTALPHEYRLSAAERLVLLVLACDSFDGIRSRPGYAALQSWSGLSRGVLMKALNSLCTETAHRPALLSRQSKAQGRHVMVWQLQLEQVGVPDQLRAHQVGTPDRLAQAEQVGVPDHSSEPEQVGATGRVNRSAQQVGVPDHTLPSPFPKPPNSQPDRTAKRMVATAVDDSPAAAPRHPHEANAASALASLKVPLDGDELLSEAHRIGAGDPWAGYLRIKHVAQQDLSGVRDPASVLRSRVRGLIPAAPVVHSDPWNCPTHGRPIIPNTPGRCDRCAEEVAHAASVQ